jgi:hypothetical protein
VNDNDDATRLTEVCRHCEKRPREHPLGLCAKCARLKGIRRLYKTRFSPEREARIRALMLRAGRGEPLFN